MPVQQIFRERALLVAKHEFGHWLMAARLGFAPGDIEITITHLGQGHYGGASIMLDEETKSIENIQLYIRRRIAVLFAGCLAESLSADGKVNREYAIDQLEGATGGAKDDFSKIRELLRVLRNIEYPTPKSSDQHAQQLKALQDPIWNMSDEIIEQDREIVLGMGGAIASKFRALDVPFGMKEQEIRNLPKIKGWLETVAHDQYSLRFR